MRTNYANHVKPRLDGRVKRLIKDLVQPERTADGKETMHLDRQRAVIFELRHFKRYYPLSYRTLNALKQTWATSPLISEMDLTIEYIIEKKNEVKEL